MEIAYCYEQGIPHSRFLEQWSPQDRAKVAAYTLERAEVCSNCGTAEWEWVEDRHAYHPVHQTCPGCAAKERLRDDDTPPGPGTSVVLLPRETAEQLIAERKDTERRRAERRRAEKAQV